MFEFLEFFSSEYQVALTKFRNAVTRAGGQVSQYRHPSAIGAQGEDLTIDVGYVGDPTAERQLL